MGRQSKEMANADFWQTLKAEFQRLAEYEHRVVPDPAEVGVLTPMATIPTRTLPVSVVGVLVMESVPISELRLKR